MRTRLILVLVLLAVSFRNANAQDNDALAGLRQSMEESNRNLEYINRINEEASRQAMESMQASIDSLNSELSNDTNSSGFAIHLLPKASKPQFSLKSGKYASVQTVTITDSMPDATIYYTTSGSYPTTDSDRYTGPVSIVDTSTLMAIAVVPGYSPSSAMSADYTLKVTPPPFVLVKESTATTTLSDDIAGAKIYYTLDGSEPTTSSTLYAGFALADKVSLKAIAVAPGYAPSVVSDISYGAQDSK